MRIKSLTISWFRGAAEPVTLETGENSVVVYGPNGAGKSSFVDALEYLLSQGKVAHLANEYSGRRLENAVINTQIPKSMETEARLNLTNGSIVSAKIGKSNSPTFSGSSSIEGWRKDRIVLRQEEVCAFVQADKGEKYSSILPLIGLGPIELIAINLRALSKRVQTEASVLRDRGALAELEKKWVQAKISTYEAGVLVKALHVKYRPDVECPETLDQTVAELLPIVNGRVQNTSSETRQFLQLTNVLNASIDEKLLTFLCKNNKASALSEPLLNERLSILTATSDFVAKLSRQEASVVCPSCGQEVQLDNFSAHVNTETLRLKQAIEAFSNRDRAYNILLDGIQAVANAFRSADLQK